MAKSEKIVTLLVKVIPKSAKEGVVGWEEEELKIKLTEVPEKGKANEALIAFLAKQLGVSKKSITITKGETARHKRILIVGLDEGDVMKVFPKEGKLF